MRSYALTIWAVLLLGTLAVLVATGIAGPPTELDFWFATAGLLLAISARDRWHKRAVAASGPPSSRRAARVTGMLFDGDRGGHAPG